MLGICYEHYDPWNDDDDHGEPRVYLVRFAGTTKHPGFDRSAVMWKRDLGEDDEEERDSWRWGHLLEYSYAYKVLPLATITSLDQVASVLVNPLIALDRTEKARAPAAQTTA